MFHTETPLTPSVGFRYNGFRMKSENIHQYLPLAPASLHILLSLTGEHLHGYGIMRKVTQQSEGRLKLGPGTLYDNLQRLLSQGLIMDAGRRREDDSRRRYYRLTSLGKRVLAAEIERLEDMFATAKSRLGGAKPVTA